MTLLQITCPKRILISVIIIEVETKCHERFKERRDLFVKMGLWAGIKRGFFTKEAAFDMTLKDG